MTPRELVAALQQLPEGLMDKQLVATCNSGIALAAGMISGVSDVAVLEMRTFHKRAYIPSEAQTTVRLVLGSPFYPG